MLPTTPNQIFDRLDRAHAAWTRGGATVEVVNATPTGTSRTRFRLDLDGKGGASLRLLTPERGKYAAMDQGYLLRGGAIFGVDYEAREAIRRPAPDQGPIAIRLAAVLGGLDDSVGFLTSREVRDRYLLPLRTLRGWQATPGGLLRTTVAAGRTSRTRVSVDASGRMRNLHVELPGSRLDWTFAYGPSHPMPVPKGLRLVEAFTARPRPPKYAGAEAKRVTEGLLAKASGLTSMIVRLDGTATMWVSGSRIRYEAAGTGFAYDGRRLTIVTPGAAYQGRTSRRPVIDQVAALLGTVDPFARTILVRAPPFLNLFPAEARVRVVGTMAADGVSCDVLEVSTARLRTSIFARRTDHLPMSIETSTLDDRGEELSTTRRAFRWSSVGEPLAGSLFALRLRPGQRVLPLPALPPRR